MTEFLGQPAIEVNGRRGWILSNVNVTPWFAEWLWDKFSACPENADDFTDKMAWVSGFWNPAVRRMYIEGAGVLSVTDVIPESSASVHVTFWALSGAERKAITEAALAWVIREFALHRVTAAIPAYNMAARTFVNALGFKAEGIIRQAVLQRGTHHDLLIYGLLSEELYGRRTNGASTAVQPDTADVRAVERERSILSQ